MAILRFDELNRLHKKDGKQRSMSIERFFDGMEISDTDKEERKQFAMDLEDKLFIAIAFLFLALQNNVPDGVSQSKNMVEQYLIEAVRKIIPIDSALLAHISNFSSNFIDITVRNSGNIVSVDNNATEKEKLKISYYFSEDRARLNAENETNSVFNYAQFRQAVDEGKTQKEWLTMKDERVRRTHADIDGAVVRINDYFHVGSALLRFPRDVFGEAAEHPEETVNCRCSLKYF